MAVTTVLINGAEVRDRYLGNRGAEHLLRTAASRLRAMGMRPAVTIGQVDPFLVSELGLLEYVGNPRLDKLDSFVPPLETNKFVGIKALDAVLDASGFALGDAWGPGTAKWLLRKYRQWHKSGVPIIALPQAYGPFTESGFATMCGEALRHCEIIFPRDEASASHLRTLGLGDIVQRSVPDISIGEGDHKLQTSRVNRLVIVPNWNLAERGDRGAYFASLVRSAEWARNQGMEVVGLLHEGTKDLELLRLLRSEVELRIVADLTGWETKEFIAASSLIVSGRYHAVLAALTTGTPVLTHSWSHKYQEVLAQFGVEDWLASPDDAAGVEGQLNAIASFSGNEELEENRRRMQASVNSMWNQIDMFLHSLKA